MLTKTTCYNAAYLLLLFCPVEVAGIPKKFASVTAVGDASFNIMEGEIFEFSGPKGAGETTDLVTTYSGWIRRRLEIVGVPVNRP